MSKSNTEQIIPTIEKGIPIPVSRKKRAKEFSIRINWPFLDMEHGDSFLLPLDCDKKKAHSALSAMKRRNQIPKDRSLVIRQIGDDFRVWLVKENM